MLLVIHLTGNNMKMNLVLPILIIICFLSVHCLIFHVQANAQSLKENPALDAKGKEVSF